MYMRQPIVIVIYPYYFKVKLQVAWKAIHTKNKSSFEVMLYLDLNFCVEAVAAKIQFAACNLLYWHLENNLSTCTLNPTRRTKLDPFVKIETTS